MTTKRMLLLLFCALYLSAAYLVSPVITQNFPPMRVREIDGLPTVNGVREIRVTNGKLTNLGSGIISLDLSGGGGAGPITNGAPANALMKSDGTNAVDSTGTVIISALTTDGIVKVSGGTGTLGSGLLLNADITNGTIDLTTKVTGILPSVSGGTGNSKWQAAGPSLTTKTYTFPNASSTVLTDNAAVTVVQGGVGQVTYTKGDLLTAPGGASLNKLGVGSDGFVLTADAASTNGVKWAAAATSGPTINATNGIIPYRSSSSAFLDSPITASVPGSMVDGYTVTGSATGSPGTVSLRPTGSDSHITSNIAPKGTSGQLILMDNATDQLTIRQAGSTYYLIGVSNTATNLDMAIAGAGAPGAWEFKHSTGHLFAENDNSFDIGASGANRPRTGYFGTSLIAPLVQSTGTIRLKGYTVATLPAGTVGDAAYVTDALAPTFLATVVGGGAVVTPVFFNGSNWVGY